jgi:hypothetical protein
MSAGPTVGTGWCFGADGADDLGDALMHFLGSLEARCTRLTRSRRSADPG